MFPGAKPREPLSNMAFAMVMRRMGAGEYTLFEVDGQMVGGTIAPQMPGVPNHWHVYFAVTDADAAVAKATELGGTVMAEPFDTPVGRMAVVSDPQGAVFSIMQPAPQPE